jgi:hypothetical protein
LTHYSEFFRAALKGNFREATDRVVKLADTEPHIFECYVHWLYYQRFPDASKGDAEELEKAWGSSGDTHTLTTNLIRMYVFGDQNIIPQLQKDALDAIFHHVIPEPNTFLLDDEQVKCAFDYLDAEDPICRFLVDLNLYYDYYSDDPRSLNEVDKLFDWPIAYLRAFARRAKSIIWSMRCGDKDIDDFELVLCDYHEHKTDEEREACEEEQERKRQINNA